MSEILVLRALGLGDTLAAVPALRALRAGLGSERIVLAGPPGPGALLVRAGVVDEVRPASGLDRLDDAATDLAVNLHGRGPRSHRLLRRAGADRIVGFACPEADVAGPRWRPDEPERDRWCRLIASAWDVPTDPDDVRLPLPREGPRAPIVVHPGAASAARRWPARRWARLVAALASRRVVITGSADERPIALQVARAAGLPPDRVLAGRTSVAELAGLVGAASLVLSGDTGVAHLAYAGGTPSVTLFGPTPPRWWGPPASGPHVALWAGVTAADPHAQAPDPALLRISVDDVVSAVHRLEDEILAR